MGCNPLCVGCIPSYANVCPMIFRLHPVPGFLSQRFLSLCFYFTPSWVFWEEGEFFG